MGFFTGLNRAQIQARAEAAGINYLGDRDALSAAGYKGLPGNTTLGDAAAKYVAGGKYPSELEYPTEKMDAGVPMAAVYLQRKFGIGESDAAALAKIARNKVTSIPGPEIFTHLRNQAPGAQATQIKTSGPSQAQQIAAGTDPAGTWDMQMAEKDWRNALAAKEVGIVQRDLVPGMDKGEIVRQLNDPDVRDGQNVIDALQNDPDYMMMYNAGPQAFAGIKRPDNLIGEGKFKQVFENDIPGMVTAYQPQVVEWNGFSEGGRTLGPRQSPGGGLHYAPEELRAERDIMDALSKVGIAPKVGDRVYDYDDGSAYLMQDLRQNYTDMSKVYDSRVKEANAAAEAGDEKKLGRLQRQERLRNVKQNQQEAMAGVLGYQLYDRPGGIHNVMNHNMMDRPMQVDLGMHDIVEGPARDNVMAMKAVAGLQAAGLSDEAEILDGLMREAVGRGDNAAFHNLAQQGVASLQKIRQIPENIGSYQQLLPQEEMPF